MPETQPKLQEMVVYKCPICNGSGKDFSRCNPYEPVGFSREAAERRQNSITQCSGCDGRGFILKPK